mgnify:CR=1 FL=1
MSLDYATDKIKQVLGDVARDGINVGSATVWDCKDFDCLPLVVYDDQERRWDLIGWNPHKLRGLATYVCWNANITES